MSALETIKAAYAAFGRNDPSVLFAAMDPAINWNEAEGYPLADAIPTLVRRPLAMECSRRYWRRSETSPPCPAHS
jgi:hypothetical protein